MTVTEQPALIARPPLLGQGVACALLAAGLLGLAVAGHLPLLAGAAFVQLLSILGFLALVEAPASGGIFVIGAAAALGADAVVAVDDGRVGGLAGVVGLSLMAGLLHQLARRERSRVTESLADTIVIVVLVCSAACLAAAVQQHGGSWPVRAALAAAGVALLAGRVGDAIVHRPALALGSTRAWPGLLLALGAGAAVSAVVADGHLTQGRATLVGLVAAATVAAVDLTVDLAAAELSPDPGDARRVAALRPSSVVLPFALLGPVVLLVVRLLERA